MLSLLLKGEEIDRDCGSIMQTMHGGSMDTAEFCHKACPERSRRGTRAQRPSCYPVENETADFADDTDEIINHK